MNPMTYLTLPRVLAALLCLSALVQISHADQSLAGKNGCLGCHAVATKLVGPAFKEVAARYAGQADALETLAKHIQQGGTGRWGDMPMPPQQQLTPADAKKLAAWVLSVPK